MFKAVLFFLAATCAALCSGAVLAADQPVYGPVPAWVKPAAIPAPGATADADGAPVQVLMQDAQSRFGEDGDQFYHEYAFKILAPQGLSVAGSITQTWNPETDTLYIHRVNIIRGGKVIDVLADGQKFIVLRRENQLEQAMLDGNLTATIQPEGLEVGDIIDVVVSLKKNDPTLKGYSESLAAMRFPGVVGRARLREVWPDSKPIHWRMTDGLGQPTVTHAGGQTEVTLDLTNVRVPKPPRLAPRRFNNLAEMEVTQFASWAEVSSLMDPLYAKASELSPDSPLKAEIAKIAAATTDPKERAAMALHLVQDKTRYVFLGMDFGGYVPAQADRTWARRFGDCKGKTALLLALLHGLGITAQPALVSTVVGDGLDERLPLMNVFDHVMVRAEIGGKAYWLDGTREGDRGLDDLTVPDFHWTLLVQPQGGHLEKLQPAQLAAPGTDSVLTLDASGGMDVAAPAHEDILFRGDDAIRMKLNLTSITHVDAERFLKEFWNRTLPWITITKVSFAYDAAKGEMLVSMDGLAKMDWTPFAGMRDFNVANTNLGATNASFTRQPGPHQDAPYAAPYPNYNRTRTLITLPGKGVGFLLGGGADIDQTVAGVEYRRHSKIDNGVAVIEVSDRALKSEFPASEADAAAVALREMARLDVVVRAIPTATNGPPPPMAATQAVPTTALGFGRRGAAALRRGDYDYAIADFDNAARLDPTSEQWVYLRGVTHMAKGQNDLALADLGKAIVLAPADANALMARAEIYVHMGNVAKADMDFDAAARLSPDNAGFVMQRANAYADAKLYDAAIRTLSQYIAGHPTAAGLHEPLNERCWFRAIHDDELDLALADCSAALKLKPDFAAAMDSRGFVELRLGKLDAAIADYTAALAVTPNLAESLYGRGLAEARKGLTAKASADIAAAKILDPKVADEYAGYGVTR